MAARVTIAIRETDALARIMAAVLDLSQRHNVPTLAAWPTSKDPDIERALRYEAIADQMEAILAASVTTTPAAAPRPKAK